MIARRYGNLAVWQSAFITDKLKSAKGSSACPAYFTNFIIAHGHVSRTDTPVLFLDTKMLEKARKGVYRVKEETIS